jgi:7-cyano-7-deazaguanine synthase
MARESHRLALLHISYGQRTEAKERKVFEQMADYFRAAERLVVKFEHFAQIGGSALTDKRIPVPEGRPGSSRGIPPTYVPFRNAHFLAVAVSWAEVIGAGAVYIGAVEEDSSGYPDCRPNYYRIFQDLVHAGTRPETRITIATPVIGMRKSEIVRRGAEVGAPLEMSWSCYQAEDAACGMCDSCVLRLRAFAEAGIEDPISYSTQVGR